MSNIRTAPPAADPLSGEVEEIFRRAVSNFVQPLEKLTGVGLWLAPAQPSQVLPPSDCQCVCRFRRANKTCVHCLKFHFDLRERARKASAPQTAICENGLTSCVVAIRVHSNVLSFIEGVFGLSRARDPQSFESLLRPGSESGESVNIEDLDKSCLSIPVVLPQQVEAMSALLAFVAMLISRDIEQRQRDTEPADLDPLQKATRFIEMNFTDKLRLSTVARAAGFSEDYFSRRFRQAIGMSFKDYVAKRRIAHAQELLLKKDTRISEVAFACGFESISHFNRSFKEVTRTSPKLYRNSKRLAPSQ